MHSLFTHLHHLSEKRLHLVATVLPSSNSSSSLDFHQALLIARDVRLSISSLSSLTNLCVWGEGILDLGFEAL